MAWLPSPRTADPIDDATWIARSRARVLQSPPWPDPESCPPDPEDGECWARDLTGTGQAHYPGAPPVPGVRQGPGGGFGQDQGPGGGFGQGQAYDTADPEPVLAVLADQAAGPGRGFTGVDDDALMGLIGARSRLSARQAWELLTALAELIRRRPGPYCPLEGAARMPRVWAEGTAAEVSVQLAVTQRAATTLLTLAWDLTVKLPRTASALRAGILDQDKAATIAGWTAPLTQDQARAAEDLLFTAGPDLATMTWTMVRDRIARAVLSIDPDAARKRRQSGERDACVETGLEQSGNMRISARELPPAAALALDRKLTRRARELKKAGVPGTMNRLRVLAYLERWGITDPFTPPSPRDHNQGCAASPHPGEDDPENDDPDGGGTPPASTPPASTPPASTPPASTGPASTGPGAGDDGTAGWLHLTVPASTITGHGDQAGQLSKLGPVDADLARTLAASITRNEHSTICVTATAPDGTPVAHACAKPARGDPARRRKPGPPGTGPPPASGSGTWRLSYAGRDLDLVFEPLTGTCDHQHQSPGHDPGKHLRHLTAVLHQDCTFGTCRTPEHQSDYEHAVPWPQGRTCACNGHPCCRGHHRTKQQPGWHVTGTGQPGYFTWITPSGRTYTSKPTSYPT